MLNPVVSSLLRINRQRVRGLRQALTPYGYKGSMHLIVAYLNRFPGANQEEIARHYAIDKTSVARDARRLEEMGHILRETIPENRRQYRLYLTDAGRDVFDKITHFYDGFAEKISADIAPDDWAELTLLLKKLEENSCK